MTDFRVPRSHRYQAWVALFVFSCVSLAAHESVVGGDRKRYENWVTSVLSMSIAFAFFGIIAHFVANEQFVGKLPEGGLAGLVLGVWVTGLPSIMKPGNNLAQTTGGINNANLYFFSWAGFIAILFIFGNCAQEMAGRNYVARTDPKTANWYALTAASLVMLCASAQVHHNFNCRGGYYIEETCVRNRYAMSIGALGALLCALMVIMTSRGMLHDKPIVEVLASLLLLILFIAGVALITFGRGPGTVIGNLFFAAWISFVVSVVLFLACAHDFMESRMRNDRGGSTNTTDNTIENTLPTVPADADDAKEDSKKEEAPSSAVKDEV